MTLETPKQVRAMSWKGLLVAAILAVVVMASTINYSHKYIRELANQRGCVKNLKDLWSASMMYAQDYDGWMPIYRNSVGDSSPMKSLEPYSDLVGVSSPQDLRLSLDKYVKEDSSWFCSSHKCLQPREEAVVNDYQHSTYYFLFCKPGILRCDGLVEANLVTAKIPWAPEKSRTDGLIRSNLRVLKDRRDPSNFILIQDDPFAIKLPSGELISAHGKGKANSIYLDGHVETN